MKKKILISSMLTIVLCLTLIAGSTYALFTDKTEVNVAVTSGTVDVEATIADDLYTWSLGQSFSDAKTDGTFVNGGVAQLVDGKLTVSRMTPGDTVQFTINVTNNSTVAMQYKVNASTSVGDYDIDLSDALVCNAVVNGTQELEMNKNAKSFESDWVLVEAQNGVGGTVTAITVTITFPNGTADHDNDFQSTAVKTAGAELVFTVEAVQGNGVDANGELITP